MSATRHNLSPTRTRHAIYHPHKALNFSNKGIPKFGIWKPQMKFELKDSRILNYKILDRIIQFFIII